METDLLIQEKIKRKFRNCNLVTVAHRLDTIIQSDKILVLSRGLKVEFDYLYILHHNEKSSFSKIVASTGKKEAESLKKAAMLKSE